MAKKKNNLENILYVLVLIHQKISLAVALLFTGVVYATQVSASISIQHVSEDHYFPEATPVVEQLTVWASTVVLGAAIAVVVSSLILMVFSRGRRFQKSNAIVTSSVALVLVLLTVMTQSVLRQAFY